ncbi:hypothetical protein T281_02355 [Rhodomicrobium udaipurense JA643]|nr:hypothetical protein T281_02355 [Rhodomicrobium udaipurense JA643]
MHFAAFHLANGDENPARGRKDRAFQDWCRRPSDEDGLPPLQPGRIVSVHGERRDAVQRRLDRSDRAHESTEAVGTIAQVFERFQRNRILFVERADARAPERRYMPETAERAAEIARDGADIGALAAVAEKAREIGRNCFLDFKLVDGNLPWLKLHHFAVAGEVVGALAVDLDRGIAGRSLHDVADELRQRSLHLLCGRASVARANGLAFRVVGVGLDAPADGEVVGLLAIDHMRDRLRRLAERDGQYAGRQRIERAGMAHLPRVEQAFQARQRLIRRQPLRLVENEPAVNLVALVAARHRFSLLLKFYLRSRATSGERSSSSMRSAASSA